MSKKEKLTPLQKVMSYVIGKDGEIRPRRKGPERVLISRSVFADIEGLMLRKPDPRDFNPAVLEALVTKWKREGLQAMQIRTRVSFVVEKNRIANHFGFTDLHDFGDVSIYRYIDGRINRAGLPTPDIVETIEGVPERLNMPLRELLDDHYRVEKLLGKSQRTIQMYLATISAFAKYIGRQPIVADLNVNSVSEFIDYLLSQTRLSRHTIQKDSTQLKVLWNYSYQKGWIRHPASIPNINVPERAPKAWTLDELSQILAACESSEGLIGRIPASEYWAAMVCLIYDTGERISAVLGVKHTDITTDGWLTVPGEIRKGGRRDKQFKLRPATHDRIKLLRRFSKGIVFPWPYYKTYIWRKFGKVIERAGLPNDRRSKFHCLRRSVASHFEAAGGNATELLDHQHRRTTRRYLDARFVKTSQPADLIPGIGETIEELKARNEAGEITPDVLDQIKQLIRNLG